MSSKGMDVFLVVVAVTMMICSDRVKAQSGCSGVLVGLAPCLNFVTGNSSTPSSSCCSQLTSVVQAQPQCLCALLNGGGSSLGITINQTLALSLPGACNVQTPPISRCNAANNGPATSPMSPPTTDPTADSPSSTTDVPSVPEGTSKTAPTAGGTSDASITKMQLHSTLFIIFIASAVSNFMM
ncbi:Non-specific lipid transfer protein GPI-anchored 5 [Euphorbia peplus]|nr:Non-specific lipid transfer protein GPI-anchored 5 [Euphorbia peplus]